MDETPRPELPADALTLPAAYYVSDEHFAVEFERIFARQWICAGGLDDLEKHGDSVVLEIGPESLLFVRDESGRINGCYNVCRHRGTRLVGSPSRANLGKRIQCPYHAWTYDLAGKLLAAPHMREGCRFRLDDFPLISFATDVWEGRLFFNFGPDPEPLSERMAGLSEKFAPWGMAALKRSARVEYTVEANWKLLIQNYSECLHCPVIHPALQKLSHYLGGVNEPDSPNRACLGGAMSLREGITTMSSDGVSRRSPLPGLNDAERRIVGYHAILPNLLLSLHPDYLMTHEIFPVSAGRTRVVCEWSFHPDEIARPDFDPSDALEFWDLTNRQDWAVSELTQLGMNSRAYRPGPYSDREDLLYEFDRRYLADLEFPETTAPDLEERLPSARKQK